MMLPIGIAASFSQYCLSEREIPYQPWPGLQQYSWQDVAAIETSSTYSRAHAAYCGIGRKRGKMGSRAINNDNGQIRTPNES